MMTLKIGTRASKLALAQSNWVKAQIEKRNHDISVELVHIRTTGDKVLDSPLSNIGGKGLFVKEIEDALLDNRVDVAVHSMKDVPAALPEGLILSTFPKREDPRDSLISQDSLTLDQLPTNARVGTSSLRRAAQLLHIRRDLDLAPLRGNVDTRLKKLEAGDFSAIILATAGLKRLGLEKHITTVITTDQILPAIGQGALGLEIRADDKDTFETIKFLNHDETEVTVRAERAFLHELEGGCQVPIAGLARLEGETVHLTGMVAELDGSMLIRDQISGTMNQAEEIGITLARRLLERGADDILKRIYGNGISG
ncbi:hydroxymethylbilane synthase [uncultured Desulfobacterium sp.]|uniref:Porphobilinogen deaminase n=1 Tax=uncultured Desulfobacterium sp. TaxID=201089 RepID=A0A445N273_9BACT|nr:hydroxymethylbilane synthase [uncultured Desulfobacterium sp.]